MIEDLAKLAEELGAAQRTAAGTVGHAESDDGLIRAAVDGQGVLTELVLDPRIYRTQDSTALAESIRTTIIQAAEDAALKAFTVMRKILPGAEQDEPLMEPVLAELRRRTGGTEPWAR